MTSYLDRLDDDAEDLLRLAWRLVSRVHGSSYYSLPLRSSELAGDRPWVERWHQLAGAVRFEGRRVLELGANMGLLSSFALVHGAEAAVAADRDAVALRAGQLVASALGVFPTFVHCDFAYSHGWEDVVSRSSPDLVVMLNVLHWVDDQDRLLRFCARFGEVLVEDNAPFADVERRFRAAGFRDVRLAATTELGRPLVVARS